MEILIIDDQPDVVEGIIIGVNWNILGIKATHKAHDIFTAQRIIQSHNISIMLCDIEMPLGNGLELYEWVIDNSYQIKCIFLTAHSDFAYAQQAVKLQGFDYLVQTVTYQQIEEAIQRAIDKIKTERVLNEYYQYGVMLKKRENLSIGSMMRDYLLQYNNDVEKNIQLLAMMSFEIRANTMCGSFLVQTLAQIGQKRWDNDLFLYALNNILNELLAEHIQQMVIVPINKHFNYLLYIPTQECQKTTINRILHDFIDLGSQYLGHSFAVYEGKPDTFTQQPKMLSSILALAQDNVAGSSKFFTNKELESKKFGYNPPDFAKWETLAEEGGCNAIQAEAIEYIDTLVRKGTMSSIVLRHFHQDLIFWFFSVLKKHGIKAHTVFSQDKNNKYNYEALMSSYTSVERMKNLITFITHYLKDIGDKTEEQGDRIEEVVDYIHQNIQRNITRKDLAEEVYLNPEYLSRLFKKEKGCTLSEFILHEKMSVAKSLLESTNFSISIIASKVGYSNFSHFAQCFKKELGISPSEFRQKKSL